MVQLNQSFPPATKAPGASSPHRFLVISLREIPLTKKDYKQVDN